MSDYYSMLGVTRGAADKEIRQAYRKLARQYHPDLNPGDKKAESMFKRINEAYEVLSDPESRKKYDKYGDQWKRADQIKAQYGDVAGSPFSWTYRTGRQGRRAGVDPFSGLGDLLTDFGGFGGRRGRSAASRRIEAAVEVTLEEAYSGAARQVTISSAGSDRRIEVSIPPGVDTGSVVRISPGGGQELLLNITVAPHKRFIRKGTDLHTDVAVPLENAILGGEVEVRTMKGLVSVKVPPESQNGQRIRLAEQGMPKLGSKDTRGDLYVVIRPKMPRNLTGEQRELIRSFRALRAGEEVTSHDNE